MPSLLIVGGAILVALAGVYILVLNPLFMWLHLRHMKQMQQSIDWQFQKMDKFLYEGWRPTLWDENATDKEKTDAIERYLKGDM